MLNEFWELKRRSQATKRARPKRGLKDTIELSGSLGLGWRGRSADGGAAKSSLSRSAVSGEAWSMDAMLLTAAAAALNHALGSAKALSSAVKEIGKIEMVDQVLDLQSALGDVLIKQQELVQEIQRLSKANEELQKMLELTGKMNFRKPFYIQDGDRQPFCPQCWESSKKAIHINGPKRSIINNNEFVHDWHCNNCKSAFRTRYDRETEANRSFDY